MNDLDINTEWWDKRKEFRVFDGYIEVSYKPDYSDFILIESERDNIFMSAAKLIELFEISMDSMSDNNIQIADISLKEQGGILNIKNVGLCPHPKKIQSEDIPNKFKSLSVLFNENKKYEIWFVVQISIAKSGFTWRLDWTYREKGLYKSLRYFFNTIKIVLFGLIQAKLEDSHLSVGNEPHYIADNYIPSVLKIWNECIQKLDFSLETSSNNPLNNIKNQQPEERQ